jgi:hypothetical protein
MKFLLVLLILVGSVFGCTDFDYNKVTASELFLNILPFYSFLFIPVGYLLIIKANKKVIQYSILEIIGIIAVFFILGQTTINDFISENLGYILFFVYYLYIITTTYTYTSNFTIKMIKIESFATGLALNFIITTFMLFGHPTEKLTYETNIMIKKALDVNETYKRFFH